MPTSPRRFTTVPLVTVRRGGRPCPPRTPRQRCHSEPVTDVTGVGIRSPRPQARNPKASLVQRAVSRPLAVTQAVEKACHSEPVTDVTGVGIRPPRPQARLPGGCFQRGRARTPSLFGRFKERGFLRGEGNRNPSPLKPFFGYFLSGKKVPRRRQKKKKERVTRRRQKEKEKRDRRSGLFFWFREKL